MGGHAEETFVKPGKGELIGEVVAFIKQNGLVAGVGSHMLELPILSEQHKFNPDFYFKTFNSVGIRHGQFAPRLVRQNRASPVAHTRADNTRDIAAFMKAIKKPWIAFKVLGAGRVLPKEGFDLAFKSGADFINVGMYDFQVAENVESGPRHGEAPRAARPRLGVTAWHTNPHGRGVCATRRALRRSCWFFHALPLQEGLGGHALSTGCF